jgi:hypothetical protein
VARSFALSGAAATLTAADQPLEALSVRTEVGQYSREASVPAAVRQEAETRHRQGEYRNFQLSPPHCYCWQLRPPRFCVCPSCDCQHAGRRVLPCGSHRPAVAVVAAVAMMAAAEAWAKRQCRERQRRQGKELPLQAAGQLIW